MGLAGRVKTAPLLQAAAVDAPASCLVCAAPPTPLLQSTFEDVALDTNRGHTVAAVGECFQLAKDAGFKVGGCVAGWRFPC